MAENVIGVDVSKHWIDVFDPACGAERVGNQPKELRAFARRAAKQDAFVVFEACGGYEAPLWLALERAGARLHRANPGQARCFAKATGALAKTDRIDARLLAEMGQRLELTPTAPVAPERRRLSALATRRLQLVEMRKQESTRLQQTADPQMRRSIERHVRYLDRGIAGLEAEIAAEQATPSFAETARRLKSAPGVGPVVATTLLAELPELGTLDRRRIAALAGLAPVADDSGQRRGARRIKGGRPVVRRMLYLAGLSASRCDPELKAFRQKLEARGRAPKQAIIAVARKLLVRLNAMLRAGADYAPS